ncbi:response regulator transcription factor [Acinetobacter baumannii]|uniref:hypothetical protein n=1 Tax=Acinetobacter baumannii TaxID=470 RepID=UPI0021CA1BA6|nr:hypothetical protein [Acinetobacter baumannii]EHU1489773.1 response regulator transcription factor [Acinetobacter baumannii]MDI9751391.1 hypothetical protein [Acinetobacter baumannii]
MSEELINTLVSVVVTAILAGIGYLVKKFWFEKPTSTPNISNTPPSQQVEEKVDKNNIYELRQKIKILFIDDDTKFQTAKMLKNSGWQNTNIIKDCKNLNAPEIIETDIFFVDIHGVGIELGFSDHGLGLAAALKQKYPEKKVVIYSAEKQWDSFHKAWNLVDDRLPKDADTYQFESTIESLLLG